MLRVCVFLVITTTLWGIYSAQDSHNFKVRLLETSVEQCSGDYFDCGETDLAVSDYNDTLATGNGLVKLVKDVPQDMNISIKIEAQKSNNAYYTVFDTTMPLCSYLTQYRLFSGIITDYWEEKISKASPKDCPISAGCYIITDAWVNETRLPPEIPKDVEMYSITLRLDYLDAQMLGCKFQAQIVR